MRYIYNILVMNDNMYIIIASYLHEGDVLVNPTRGNSTICMLTPEEIRYKRGQAVIRFAMSNIQAAYSYFKGRQVSSVELKDWGPKIFDSNRSGHSCNATFFMQLMTACGLTAGGIQGRGTAHHPYFIQLL